jgi:SAM-dependent methyltransferase
MIQEGKYVGSELALFEKAHNWKRYFKNEIIRYLRGNVLEIGAGIGGTTAILCDGTQDSWLCLEPDQELASELQEKISQKRLPSICSARSLYLKDLDIVQYFDAILYMDVIEHIENDKEEIRLAISHLKPNGHLIILVPANQYLYSPFDKKIGHYRRYSKKMLRAAIPSSVSKVSLKYMDSVGYFASLANKIVLRKDIPSEKDIFLWDKFMIPVSKRMDFLLNYSIGKSLLGIWSKK